MTPQERELLQSLADRIATTQVPQKDPQAQAFILQKIGSKPDALYILTQTVLIQEMALNQANKRLHELSEQQSSFVPSAPAQPTSFLGRLFGFGASAPPPAYYAEPVYAAPAPGFSFLRSAAATATGVAAGALAFEGIEALLHGGFGGGYGGYGGGEFLQGAPNETVINNYYGNDSGDNSGGGQDYNNDNTGSDTNSDTNYDSSSDDASSDYSSNDN